MNLRKDTFVFVVEGKMVRKEKKMMLYKILFRHTAPKDTKIGIETYLLAENERDVYGYIDKEYNYGCWKDREDDGTEFPLYDDKSNKNRMETFREKMMRLRGEMYDDEFDYSDAYYGITLYGWELMKEDIVVEDFREMIDLGIIKEIGSFDFK